MSNQDTARNKLYALLGKKGLLPDYETTEINTPAGRKHFTKLTVAKIPHVTSGSGLRIKDAEEEAAASFLDFLQDNPGYIQFDNPASLSKKSSAGAGNIKGRENWKMHRPVASHPKSYLKEVLDKNGVETKYIQESSSDGKFSFLLEFTLPWGTCLCFRDENISKAEATKGCAKKAIAKLRQLGLLYPEETAQNVVQADSPAARPPPITPRVESVLSSPPPAPTSAVNTRQLSSGITALTQGIGSMMSSPVLSLNLDPSGPVSATHELPSRMSAGDLNPWSGSSVAYINVHGPIITTGDGANISFSSEPGVRSRVEQDSGVIPSREIPRSFAHLLQCEKAVSENDINKVKKQIGRTRKSFGQLLGLTVPEIEDCMHNEHDAWEINRKIMGFWLEKNDTQATVKKLSEALWSLNLSDALKNLAELHPNTN